MGPYLIVAAAALFVRQSSLPAFFEAYMAGVSLAFASGAFTLMARLAMLGVHHGLSGVSATLLSLAVAAGVLALCAVFSWTRPS